MKRFFILLSCILCLASCKQGMVDSAAVKAAVSTQLETYPESRLQDLYKSFFQDRFGPGHIIRDRQSALEYILSEIEELLSSGQYAYHHSAAYEAAYHPHYRIIASSVLDF